MNIKLFRKMYPEYDDLNNSEVEDLLYKKFCSEVPLGVILSEIVEDKPEHQLLPAIEQLCEVVKRLGDATHDANAINLLQDIKSGLATLDSSIRRMDIKPDVRVSAPVVNVPAPIVNVPAPIVHVEAAKQPVRSDVVVTPTPTQIRSWTFEVTRDRNGFISSIEARA